MHETDIHRYRIIVRVNFIDIFGSQQLFKRTFHLVIAHMNFPAIRLDDKIYFLGDEAIDFETPDYGLLYEEEKQNPEAFVVSKSSDSKINIAFSKALKVVEDTTKLFRERVAVPAETATDDSFFIFDRESWIYDRYEIGAPM